MTETYPQILCIPECIECFQTVHLSVAALLLSFTPTQGCRNESRARGADRSKRTPTALGQQMYPRNGGHPRHFLGNIMGYASHSHINDCLFQQILLAFSLYDLRCIIVTIRKQIIAFKKGTFAPPPPSTERQEGRLLPPALLSGVPAPTRECQILEQ